MLSGQLRELLLEKEPLALPKGEDFKVSPPRYPGVRFEANRGMPVKSEIRLEHSLHALWPDIPKPVHEIPDLTLGQHDAVLHRTAGAAGPGRKELRSIRGLPTWRGRRAPFKTQQIVRCQTDKVICAGQSHGSR